MSALLFLLATSVEVIGRERGYAVLESFSGDVEVKMSQTEDFLPARLHMELREGAVLMTGFESSATVRFSDDSKLEIRELTRVRIDMIEAKKGSVNTRVELGVGNIRASVSKRQDRTTTFQVKTPQATVSVRGTDKEIWSYADTGTRVFCYEGAVNVAAEKGRDVDISGGTETYLESYDDDPRLPVDIFSAETLVSMPSEWLDKNEYDLLQEFNDTFVNADELMNEWEEPFFDILEGEIPVTLRWQ